MIRSLLQDTYVCELELGEPVEDEYLPVASSHNPFPALRIRPTKQLATSFTSVLESIADTVIPACERKWNLQVRLNGEEQPSLGIAFTDDCQYAPIKIMDLTVPILSPDLTVMRLFGIRDLFYRCPFGFTDVISRGGLLASHRHLASISPTENMMVIDGDNRLIRVPRLPPKPWNKTFLYYALNPYNKLTYGHGGIKIFRRQDLFAVNELDNGEDLLMKTARNSKHGLTVIPQVCSVHEYASTRREGAVTSLREAYKLRQISDTDPEAGARLAAWLDHDRYEPQDQYMAAAAKHGVSLVGTNHRNNDWDYLRSLFDDNGNLIHHGD